jgi:hypothetical protein
MRPNLPRRRGCLVLQWCGLALLLSPALGCGSSGTVSGTVYFKDKPLTGGQVVFRPANTRYNPVLGTIDPDGHFEVRVPAGEVQIGVDNRALKSGGNAPVGLSGTEDPNKADQKRAAGPPPGVRVGPPAGAIQAGMTGKAPTPGGSSEKPAGTYVKIPDKYYDPFTSGINFTVKGGAQPFDIKLE